MFNLKIAILLTTFNRKDRTTSCLNSLQLAKLPSGISYDLFLTDDNSSDKTVEYLKIHYPNINIEVSEGNLFWARGMNVSWLRAIKKENYDGFLLLNDDVVLFESFWDRLMETHQYCLNSYNNAGVYVLSTSNPITNELTYGGSSLIKKGFRFVLNLIDPTNKPQVCDITNANILLVMRNVVNKIGVFDKKYIHGIADYDYSLSAKKAGFPVLLAPGYGGHCIDDHGKNWMPQNSKLKDRIAYLYSPKGLAYREYSYYLKKHFPWQVPYFILMAWVKTLFPIIWEKVKTK